MNTAMGDDRARIRELELRVAELESEERRFEAAEVERAKKLDDAIEGSGQRMLYLANMSHEMRTPISGILGLLELVLAGHLSPGQRGHIEAIQTSAESFLDLVNQILDFSKASSDQLELEHVDFDLWSVIENVAQLMQARADQKHIDFVFDLDPSVPRRVIGDPLRLRQVLLNLGSNAIKFTERGVVALSAVGMPLAGDGVGLRVNIEDTGCGISDEAGKVIFDAFRQADSSTSRRFGGTGLGLAICREILDVMGGEMRYSSTPDVGTSFQVDLNVVTATNASDPLRAEPAHRRTALVSALRPVTETTLAKHLPTRGFERVLDLEDAANGHVEVDLVLYEAPFDAAEGQAALEKLRTRFPDAALIVLDSPLVSVTEEALGEHRVLELLPRPLRASQLHAAIDRALSGARVARPSSPPKAQPRKDFEGLRVLVAEDAKINQRVIKQQLERHGCQVTLADDGAAALACYADHGPFDLVFMDCHMPRMDGFEAAAGLRDLEEARGFERVPILALTADARDNVLEQCLGVGMDACCTKPLRHRDLLRVIERWNPQRSDRTA